jgi:phosphoglycolate phosphatase-like HAD superfamily hydrolase
MFIVSGSDQNELRYLCDEHVLSKYFKGIYGSPTPKVSLVCNILKSGIYKPEDCILVGDSINDFDAAKKNNISFLAFNNKEIDNLSDINFKF